jgi:hypothetical protein
METQVAKHNVQVEPANPAHLLEMAINKDLDIEKLTKLMELQKAWQADQARKAFFNALNEFQFKVPELRKDKKVSFKTQNGQTEYNYATLASITRQIRDTCKDFGLAYRWEISDTKDEIKVTCIITHVDGHSEKTTMTASPDGSGSKNPIQARGSAIEYMKRYTLIGALGLSTADSDIDGEVPIVSVDLLHQQYMEHYNNLIEINPAFTKWDPDNWKTERTAKVYVKAIGEIRKKLVELTGKEL